MTAIIDIRKAFEAKLKAAVDALPEAERPALRWPGIRWDDSGVDHYLRPTLHAARERPATLGPSPRLARQGFFKVGVFSRAGLGTDRLDQLADIVKAAYPYGVDLTVGAAKVQIDRRDVGDLLEPPGWSYKPVDLYWSIGL